MESMSEIQEHKHMVLNALGVVKFKILRSRSDYENGASVFYPLMAHQIFNDSETIFGYQDLKISLLYTAGPMDISMEVEYSQKVDEITNGRVKADDVEKAIRERLPEGVYLTNIDAFLKNLDNSDKFKPFGEKISEYIYRDNDGRERTFEYYASSKQQSFLKFFSRLQTFILWFVDAASYVDIDDPQWSYFLCYEKYKNDNGEEMYATVGYITVYEFYAYPENIRPRISQMLILPPFQKLGVGTKFLEAITNYYQGQSKVVDITVEDPSENFQRIRNFIDAKRCMTLQSFQREKLKNGFCNEMKAEARERFKVNHRQCRIVYEIVRLFHTNIHDEVDYNLYRSEVETRLNAGYYRQLKYISRLERFHIDTETMRAQIPSPSERKDQLHEEYRLVEREYQKVIEKLRAEL